MDPRQRSLSDVEGWARVAMRGAAEATESVQDLRQEVEDHEHRIAMLEESERPSHIGSDAEQRIIAGVAAAIEKRRAESDAPDSGVEYKTSDGRRIRGSGWPVFALCIAAVLFALIWNAPEILHAIWK